MKALELTGQKFGRLTVESQNPVRTLDGKIRWNCVCDCGNRSTVVGSSLIKGLTSSCGCYHKERVSEVGKSNIVHGMTSAPEFEAWCSMIQRCTNQSHKAYSYYGGRGITVCERWLNSFEAFYEDMGPRPSPEHSIDREENNKGYYKDNCRWATLIEQNNNRRNNVFYDYKGQQHTLLQLAEMPEAIQNGINDKTIYARINHYDYSVEEAINRPIRSTKFTTN